MLIGETAKFAHDKLIAEIMARDTKPDLGSRRLCAAQVEIDKRGFRDIIVCRTIYGYSLRWASGLQNFGLISSHRASDYKGSLDAAYIGAIAAATRWVNEDNTRRWASICPAEH